jgi:hypothetical protein
MCLWCAVPIRGVAYGNECLRLVLGDDRPVEEEAPPARATLRVVAGFALAVVATLLPWTAFGEGDSMFGAWGLSPRWATLAAVGSALGLLVAFAGRRRAHPDPRWDVAEIVLAAAVVAGSILEWFRPPFPSRPSLVPWIAATGGALALVSALRCLREDTRVVS